MFSIILTQNHKSSIEQILDANDIIYDTQIIGSEDNQNIGELIMAAANVANETLVISLTEDYADEIVTGLIAYRQKCKNTRIIVISDITEPGNDYLYQLVKRGIYDLVINEVEDLAQEFEHILLTAQTFADVSRFSKNDDFQRSPKTKVKTVYQRGTKEVVEKTVERVSYQQIGQNLITVQGNYNRIGTTKIVWTIAAVLAANGCDVAVVDKSQRDDVGYMAKTYGLLPDPSFKLEDITFYPYTEGLSHVNHAISTGHRYIIVDAGSIYEDNEAVINTSNTRFVVSGSLEREICCLEDYIRGLDAISAKKNIYLFNFTSQESFSVIKDNMEKLATHRIPYIEDWHNPPDEMSNLVLQLFSLRPKEKISLSKLTSMASGLVDKVKGVIGR